MAGWVAMWINAVNRGVPPVAMADLLLVIGVVVGLGAFMYFGARFAAKRTC